MQHPYLAKKVNERIYSRLSYTLFFCWMLKLYYFHVNSETTKYSFHDFTHVWWFQCKTKTVY